MAATPIIIQYCPRQAFRAFHGRSQRWAVIVAHRRMGKTVSCINDLIRRCLLCDLPSPRFGYIAPYRVQAKQVAWDYLKQFTRVVPGVRINESELRVDMPGDKRITLYGADNYDALRGIYLDGVVLDEPADMGDEIWHDVVRPALSDRKGWCTWIGTPKGRNAFYRLWDASRLDPDFFCMIVKASESGIIDTEELASARKAMGEASYLREYECDFSAAIEGAIYGQQVGLARNQNRIKPYAVDANLPLFTFWDIGQSDFTCLWLVQFVGRDICIVDYHCRNMEIPSYYAGIVMSWERKYSLPVKVNYLPHDAEHRGASGKTYVGYLKDAGLVNIKVVPRTPDLWLGIHELRALFPRIYLHSENCGATWSRGDRSYPSGIDCLEYYHTKEVSTQGIISDAPVHDEFSHGADALRTMAEAYRLGLIEGTSWVSKASHVEALVGGKAGGGLNVLRGVRETSYSVSSRPTVIR